jgi:hypothetical protein
VNGHHLPYRVYSTPPRHYVTATPQPPAWRSLLALVTLAVCSFLASSGDRLQTQLSSTCGSRIRAIASRRSDISTIDPCRLPVGFAVLASPIDHHYRGGHR